MTNRELAEILMLNPNNTVIVFDHNGIAHKPKVIALPKSTVRHDAKTTTVIRSSWDD